jgi:hypothetical protein
MKIDAIDRMNAMGMAAEQAALERKLLGQITDPEQWLAH